MSIFISQHYRSAGKGGRNPGWLGNFGVRARTERWGSRRGKINSVCLTLGLLTFQGRGDHFETFACTKKTPPIYSPFHISWSKEAASHVVAVMGFLGGD